MCANCPPHRRRANCLMPAKSRRCDSTRRADGTRACRLSTRARHSVRTTTRSPCCRWALRSTNGSAWTPRASDLQGRDMTGHCLQPAFQAAQDARVSYPRDVADYPPGRTVELCVHLRAGQQNRQFQPRKFSMAWPWTQHEPVFMPWSDSVRHSQTCSSARPAFFQDRASLPEGDGGNCARRQRRLRSAGHRDHGRDMAPLHSPSYRRDEQRKKRSLGRAWLTMSCSDGLSGTQGARSNQVEKKNGESVKREIARCPGRFA